MESVTRSPTRDARRLAAALLLVALLAAACGKKPPAAEPQGQTPPIAPAKADPAAPVVHASRGAALLTVGDHVFSAADVELRGKVIRFKYGDVPDLTVKAVAQILQGYLLVSVLARMGKPVTLAELQKEVGRIDADTKAPADLEKIKALFRDGRAQGGIVPGPGADAAAPAWGRAYAELFVLPDFANRRFYFDVFPKASHLQQDRLARANAKLGALLREPDPDFAAAASSDPPWRRDETGFSAARGFVPLADLDRPGAPPEPASPAPPDDASRWARMEAEIFRTLEKGAIFPQTVELDSAYLILRWTGRPEKHEGLRLVERLVLEKLGPHEYFQSEARAVPVALADPALEKDLRAKISWADELNWSPKD